MNDDQLIAIMARTDAAVGLLLAVLIEKGIVSLSEMSALLDNASDLVGESAEGAIVATVFAGMKALIDKKRQGRSLMEYGASPLQ